MPFILAKGWLASAPMEIPELCLPYMANGGGLASVVNLCRRPLPATGSPMTNPSWDESHPCVLAFARSRRVRRKACEPPRPNQGFGDDRMNCRRCLRLVMLALIPIAAISLGGALAQTPAPAASPAAPAESP